MRDLNEIAKEYGYELAGDTGIEKDGYEIYSLGFSRPTFTGLPAFLLVKGEEVEMVGGEEGYALHCWLCDNYYNIDDDEEEDEGDEEEICSWFSHGELCYWHKEKGEKIWWLYDGRRELVFSFDRVHKYYLFRDYPYKLTREQKEIFDKENPFWVDYFADRIEEWEKTHKE